MQRCVINITSFRIETNKLRIDFSTQALRHSVLMFKTWNIFTLFHLVYQTWTN